MWVRRLFHLLFPSIYAIVREHSLVKQRAILVERYVVVRKGEGRRAMVIALVMLVRLLLLILLLEHRS